MALTVIRSKTPSAFELQLKKATATVNFLQGKKWNAWISFAQNTQMCDSVQWKRLHKQYSDIHHVHAQCASRAHSD